MVPVARVLPDWFSKLKPLVSVASWLADFARNPKQMVLGWVKNAVGGWLVKGALTVLSYVLYAVYTPFDIVGDTFATTGDALIDATAPAVQAILSTIRQFNYGLAADVSGFGLAAPWVIWGATVLEFVLLLWLAQKAWQNAKPVILSFNPL